MTSQPHPLDGFQPVAADPRVVLVLDFLTDPADVRRTAYAVRDAGRKFWAQHERTGSLDARRDHGLFIELANALADYANRLEAGGEAIGQQFAEDVDAWRASEEPEC